MALKFATLSRTQLASIAILIASLGYAFFWISEVHVGHARQGVCVALWEQKMNKHMQLMASRRAAVQPGKESSFRVHTSYDAFEPTYTCHTEYRRGRLFGDGGKFVCGDSNYFTSLSANVPGNKCLVYSVGSNGDARFEQDIVQNFGCETLTFDPTGNSTNYQAVVEAAGATFHAIGVSGAPSNFQNQVTGMTTKLLPIKDIADMFGHTARVINILKIDCEGCEYSVFSTLWPQIEAGDVSIGQIQVELHGTNFSQIAPFFEGADKAGYMVFHKERNHWGCSGYSCVEFSLIHKFEAERVFKHTHCE